MSTAEAIDPMPFFIQQELHKLREEWDALLEHLPEAPAFTWTEWKEALLDLSWETRQELLIRGALSAVVKMASFKPPHLVLQELLTLTVSAADPASSRPLEEEEGDGMP
jgi:hypothetical protein